MSAPDLLAGERILITDGYRARPSLPAEDSDPYPYLTGPTIAMDGGQLLAGPGTFAGLTSPVAR